jgi:hypothetical protein
MIKNTGLLEFGIMYADGVNLLSAYINNINNSTTRALQASKELLDGSMRRHYETSASPRACFPLA